jgi:hypothetical protein
MGAENASYFGPVRRVGAENLIEIGRILRQDADKHDNHKLYENGPFGVGFRAAGTSGRGANEP